MNRQEAMQALREGKTLRHAYFSDGEWVKEIEPGTYLFEDGVMCSRIEFWADRWRGEFDKDWEEVI